MQSHHETAPKRPTMSVPEAGMRYFGLSRNASYEAARRGQIPTIKIGGRVFAIVAVLDRMVGDARADDAT
jgi:hypothetical protein